MMTSLKSVWKRLKARLRSKRRRNITTAPMSTASSTSVATTAATLTPTSSDTLSLRTRLESLPQELYDMIFDFTFTAPSGKRSITTTYRPPHLLRVSRATRILYSNTYYGPGATFVLSSEPVFRRWIQVFREPVESLVENIEFLHDYVHDADDGIYEALLYVLVSAAVHENDKEEGIGRNFETICAGHRRVSALQKKVKLVDSGMFTYKGRRCVRRW